MEKYLKTPLIIRFQDCDPFNQLKIGRFLDLIVQACEDHFLQYYKLNVFNHIKSTGNGWILEAHLVQHVNAVSAHEQVWIESKLIRFTENSYTVEVQMWNKDMSEMKSFVWLKYRYRDMISFDIRHQSEEIIQLFEEALISVEEKNFEQRAIAILSQLQA